MARARAHARCRLWLLCVARPLIEVDKTFNCTDVVVVVMSLERAANRPPPQHPGARWRLLAMRTQMSARAHTLNQCSVKFSIISQLRALYCVHWPT